MHILLTGASGFLGRHITADLLTRGHTVQPVSRRLGHDLLHLTRPVDWLPLLNKVDAVINAAGIIGEEGTQTFKTIHTDAPTALFTACMQAGVTRVVQISALGADEQAFSAFHLSKRAADDMLRASPLQWMVLRPALVYGAGGRSARLFMDLSRLPAIPVLDGGLQPVQPVHVGDVVSAVMLSMSTTEPRQTIDVVGPEIMTLADWLQAMRLAQGLRPAHMVNVPLALAQCVMRLGGLFSPLARPDNLRMLRAGYTANPDKLTALLGRSPLNASSERILSTLSGSLT